MKANLDVMSYSHFIQTFKERPFESGLDVLALNPDLNLSDSVAFIAKP